MLEVIAQNAICLSVSAGRTFRSYWDEWILALGNRSSRGVERAGDDEEKL
jgi:hypothetical protein